MICGEALLQVLSGMSCDICELVCEKCSLFVSESGRQDVVFSHFDGRGKVEIRVGLHLRALSALEVVSPTSTHPILEGFRDRFERFGE